MKRKVRTKKSKNKVSNNYFSFVKNLYNSYEPACLILLIIAFIVYSFGLWYRDIVNIILAVGFWFLCHIYSYVSMRLGVE